jgi:serine/threonine protein kinase
MNPTPPLHQGWATKKGRGLRTWKRRYFVFVPPFIEYHKAPGKGFLKRFDISEAHVFESDTHHKWDNVFIIETQNRTLVISAFSVQERDEWIEKIRRWIILNRYRACEADFERLKVLGRGSYAKVMLVRHRSTGEIYAMKSMRKSRIAECNLVERSLAERDALLQMHHPFLVSARYSFQTERKLFLVMEFARGGELRSRLNVETRFTEDRTRLYAAELVLAVSYMHGKGFVHRDLKPENILFDEKGHLKITDFGLIKGNIEDEATTATFCGTRAYMAPELANAESYTRLVDWWAVGILLFEMMSGYLPFDCANYMRLKHMIMADEIQFPRSMSPAARDLIGRLCAKNPWERLGYGPRGVEEIKRHPFFNGIDWNAVFERTITMPWVPAPAPAIEAEQYVQYASENPNESLNDDVPIPPEAQMEFIGFTLTNEALADRRMGGDVIRRL